MNRTVAVSATAALVVRTLITHYRAVLVVAVLVFLAVTHPEATANAFAGLARFGQEVSS